MESIPPKSAESQAVYPIRRIGILPVISVDSPDQALRCAAALAAGGLASLEITFRNDTGPESVAAVREKYPDTVLGAGTILTLSALERAMAAGALFGAAPGFDPEIASAAKAKRFPFFCGVCTPTEIQTCLKNQFRNLKYFPAENLGGIKTLTAMMNPFLHLKPRVIAMGSITPGLMEDYLRLPYVVAVGVSWVCPPTLIKDRNWTAIRGLAEQAVRHVSKARKPSVV